MDMKNEISSVKGIIIIGLWISFLAAMIVTTVSLY